MNESREDKMVADLKKNGRNIANQNASLSRVEDEFDSDDQIDLPGSQAVGNKGKSTKSYESPAVNSEEVRILNSNIKNMQDRIETLTKEKDAIYKFEQQKQVSEVNRLNSIHKQEIENLKSN